MRIKIFLATFLTTSSLFGQTDFEVVKLPLPKGTKYSYAQIEPSIAIHPHDQNIMAAGSVLTDYYYSTNGGKKWKSKTMKSTYGVYGDPVLLFDTTGRLYYFHLASYSKTSHLDRIVCQTTDNVKRTFTDGSYPKPNGTKAQDKQWAVLNPFNNDIYMTWTQFDRYDSKDPKDSSVILFAKSSDRGVSWTDPIRISKFAGDCLDSDETVEGAVPAVGPNGEIYVTWTGPKGLVLQKSIDGGLTWLSEEKQLEDHVGGWDLEIPGIYRANGLPILKCDLSPGPNRGTLYLNWCDQRNGSNNTDVWIKKSSDGGETWSDPLRVNQDTTSNHQFFTWMTIDQSNGNLHFIYYDRRNHADTKTDVFMTTSKDGGEQFSDIRISECPFTPDPNLFFGDYLNIDAVNGVVRPIWPRLDNGKISLWVTLVE